MVIKPREKGNELYYCDIYTDDITKYSCVFNKNKDGHLSLEECQKINNGDLVWSMSRNRNFTDSSTYAIEIVKGKYQRRVTFVKNANNENIQVYEDLLEFGIRDSLQYSPVYSYYAVSSGLPTLTPLTANELDIKNYFATRKVFHTKNGYIPDRICLDENLFSIPNGICLGVDYPVDTDFLEVLLLDDLGYQVLKSFANEAEISSANERIRRNPFSNLFRR